MSKVAKSPRRKAKCLPAANSKLVVESLVVDGHYIKEQASEALGVFLAPVSGVFRALVGTRRKQIESDKRAA